MLFSNTFGMAEVECAAETIYKKMRPYRGKPYTEEDKVYISFRDFYKDGNNMSETGFTYLCMWGYISSGYPNGLFYPNQAFMNKINAKLATLSEEDIEAGIGCRCATCVSWGIVP